MVRMEIWSVYKHFFHYLFVKLGIGLTTNTQSCETYNVEKEKQTLSFLGFFVCAVLAYVTSNNLNNNNADISREAFYKTILPCFVNTRIRNKSGVFFSTIPGKDVSGVGDDSVHVVKMNKIINRFIFFYHSVSIRVEFISSVCAGGDNRLYGEVCRNITVGFFPRSISSSHLVHNERQKTLD